MRSRGCVDTGVTEFEENQVIWGGGGENYVRQKIFFGILKLRGSSYKIEPQLVSRRRCPPALEPAPRIRGHLIESAFQERGLEGLQHRGKVEAVGGFAMK